METHLSESAEDDKTTGAAVEVLIGNFDFLSVTGKVTIMNEAAVSASELERKLTQATEMEGEHSLLLQAQTPP